MGVQILNKDVSVISSIIGKAKANISNVGGIGGWSGGGGGTWTLTFTGGNCGSINCSTNTETIPESVTLFFYAEPESGAFSWYYIKNGVQSSAYTSGDTDFVVFSTNDTLSFTFAGLEGTGNMIIRENDALGREISNFPIFVFD